MPSREEVVAKIKAFLPVVGRATKAAGIVTTVGGLGALLGVFLTDSKWATPDWAKTVLTTSFLLATMDKAIAQAIILGRWIRSGVGDGLTTFSTFLFVTFVTSVAAALAIREQQVPPNPPSAPGAPVVAQVVPRQLTAPPVVFVNIPPANPMRPESDQNVFLVPFYKEAGGCSTKSPWFEKGAKLSRSTERFIAKLAQGFAHCARLNEPVVVEIRGFASSQPFSRCEGTMKTSLNLDIANARGETVRRTLVEATAAVQARSHLVGDVKVIALPWANIEEMESERGWKDRDETGAYNKQRAILTRRAEIVVKSTGGCDVLSVPAPNHRQTAGSIHGPGVG